MNWYNFEEFFDSSWEKKIKPFIESKECDEIYAELKQRSREGRRIAPLSNLTFKAFKDTPLDEIKVILLSYCPYHSFYNGSPVADGLAFSCSITNKLQPSLEAFYRGLEVELYDGLNLEYYKSPDLYYLANQGVLLLNAALTVEKDKAGSHQKIWEPFTKYLIENVFAYTGIPIVLIGKDAQYYERYMTPLTHGHIFKIEHPSYAARIQQDWDTKGVFKKITTIVKQNNGYDIKWLCTQEEIESLTLPF